MQVLRLGLGADTGAGRALAGADVDSTDETSRWTRGHLYHRRASVRKGFGADSIDRKADDDSTLDQLVLTDRFG
jgi:hypothetical protein